MKKFIVAVAATFGILFFSYSIIEYQKTGVAERGLVTCAEGQCFWTAHIHTLVRVHLCGQAIKLPKLVGPLSGVHTHTEENILHWHDKLAVDPKTAVPLDNTSLTIGFGLQTLSISFTSSSLLEERNGDFCQGGKAGTLKFFVNGAPRALDPLYMWEDRDIIDIIFDERTLEEALDYVKTLPKAFPSLTSG